MDSHLDSLSLPLPATMEFGQSLSPPPSPPRIATMEFGKNIHLQIKYNLQMETAQVKQTNTYKYI